MKNPTHLLLCISLACTTWCVHAQESLKFADYFEAVKSTNQVLAAQRENLRIAKAAQSIAAVRPDPVLSVGTSREQTSGLKTTASKPQSFGITQTFETAGKRGQRISAAEADYELQQKNLEAFTLALAFDALDAYVNSAFVRETLKRQEGSLSALQDVVEANRKRLNAGAIGRLELSQSILETQRYNKDVETTRGNLIGAETRLSTQLGERFNKRFNHQFPSLQFSELTALPVLDHLIAKAMVKRSEILVAQAALDAARAKLLLAQSNRWVDVDVGLSLTNTPPTPDQTLRSQVIGVSVSVPLPLSRLQNGEIIQAQAAVIQTELGLQSAMRKAESEVESASAQYLAASKVLTSYQTTVLAENQRVLEGFRFSYLKGSASLLELLNAQRTADDTYLGYLDALASYARAKGQLQISLGETPDLEGGF